MADGNDTVVMPNGTLGHFGGNSEEISATYNAALLTENFAATDRVAHSLGDKALHQSARTDDNRYFTSRQLDSLRADLKDKHFEQERELTRQNSRQSEIMVEKFAVITERLASMEKAALVQQLEAAKSSNAELKQSAAMAAQTEAIVKAIKALIP